MGRKALSFLAAVLATISRVPAAFAAGEIDVGTGITQVDKAVLADKVLKVGTAFAGIAGAVAVLALIFTGLKLMGTTNEARRAEAKQQFIWILGGLALIGLASVVVGFVAWVIKQ